MVREEKKKIRSCDFLYRKLIFFHMAITKKYAGPSTIHNPEMVDLNTKVTTPTTVSVKQQSQIGWFLNLCQLPPDKVARMKISKKNVTRRN